MAGLVVLAVAGNAQSTPCGDAVVDPDEACDLGIGNDAGGSCTPECSLATCGDGVLSLLETCDDGNVLPGDGCSMDCRDESQPRWSVTVDRDASTDEWFEGARRFEDRIYVLGQASEGWQQWSSMLIAYDLEGNQLWDSFFGPEPFNRIGDFAIGDDRLFVVGRRFGSSGGTEAVIAAYRLDGSIVGESPLLGIEHLSVVLVGPDGELFLGGQQRNGDVDRWFGRYSVTDDALRWSSSEPRIGGTETVSSGVFDPAAGLYFCGEIGREAFVLRVDPDSGELLWEDRPQDGKTPFGAGANAVALAGEQLAVVGTIQFPEDKFVDWHSEGWISTYTLGGQLRWGAVEASAFASYDGLTAIAAREDGSFVVAGYQEHMGLAAPVDWDVDGLIVEYSPEGTRGRELRYDGPLHHEDNFYSVSVLDDDRVLVAGNSMALAAAEVGLIAEFELPQLSVRTQHEPALPSLESTPTAQQAPTAPHAETLYIDFDGASLKPGMDGRLEQMSCIDGPFDYPGFDGGRAFVEATVARVRQHLEPFNIHVVWETRPDPSLPYTTVLVGGAPEQLGFDDSTQGYACQVDCGNRIANELVLAFASNSEQALANTIVHEAAHAWGLDHVVDNSSLMSPFSPVEEAALLGRCVDISEATSTPVCIQEHANFCPRGQQNEQTELMARFGERRADIEAPTLLGLPDYVVGALPGQPYALSFEVEDDSGNPGAELRVPDLGVRKTLDPNAPGYEIYLPEGEHRLELRGMDHAGNEIIKRVTVLVQEMDDETNSGSYTTTGDEGDGGDEDTETDSAGAGGDAADSGCACSSRERSGGPGSALLLMLAGSIVRRRRR